MLWKQDYTRVLYRKYTWGILFTALYSKNPFLPILMLDVHKTRCMNLFKHILNILARNSIPLFITRLGFFYF